MNNTTESKNAPVASVRIGRIVGSIWRNSTETGFRYGVTFQRCYRSGTSWKYSDNFNRDDLQLLAKVADHAHSKVYELMAAEAELAAA